MPLSSIGRLVSERQPAQILPTQRVAKHFDPFQGRCPRVLARGLGQPVEEHLVGEVVLQPIAAQEREVGSVEVARAPSRHPGIQRHDNGLISGFLGASQKAGGQVLVAGGVELKQRRGVSGVRDHVFHAVLRQCARRHRHTGLR